MTGKWYHARSEVEKKKYINSISAASTIQKSAPISIMQFASCNSTMGCEKRCVCVKVGLCSSTMYNRYIKWVVSAVTALWLTPVPSSTMCFNGHGQGCLNSAVNKRLNRDHSIIWITLRTFLRTVPRGETIPKKKTNSERSFSWLVWKWAQITKLTFEVYRQNINTNSWYRTAMYVSCTRYSTS